MARPTLRALIGMAKEVKPGRKVGHINVCSHEHSEIVTTLKHLEQLLPQYYSTAIDWCLEELAR